jgi:hypothetical protein
MEDAADWVLLSICFPEPSFDNGKDLYGGRQSAAPDQSMWWTLPLGGVGGTACVPPPGRGECVDTILGHGLWPAKSVPARDAKLVGGPLRNNVVIPQ